MKLIEKILVGLLCAVAAATGAVVTSGITVKEVGFSGDGKAFVKLQKSGSFSDCGGGGNGWMYVPNEKVIALFLTAKSMGKELNKVAYSLRGGSNLIDFAHHGWVDCELQSVSME